MKQVFKILILCVSTALSAQQITSDKEVSKALFQKEKLAKESLVKNVPFTNIGPSIMSGRVADIAVNNEDPTEFFVGYASGGLWYTNNNGNTFTPKLDNSPTQNIGDIAVDWKYKTIWVGTGEKNSSRSSYAGIGILKSSDFGETWTHVGLSDSHHISRILINPNNPEEVTVAVIGHLYSPNKERGIFKTTDGGKTWKHVLFINEDTGVIDIESAPENPNIMYAASWERERKAWNFMGSGKGSAIYKSTDRGNTWSKISEKTNFPKGIGVGRIGLAVYDANTVYAFHDNQFRRDKKKEKKKSNDLTKDDFKTMSVSAFLKLSDKKLNTYLKTNGFQEKYKAQNVKQMVRSGTIKPQDLARYLEDANSLLFDTPVIGAELFLTTDGGKTWEKTHKDYLDDIYYSYGYYFGEVRVDPQDKNAVYLMGVPIIKSKDGGKTFTSISRENVHADHQALWINPKRKGHLLDGNDGGLNMSYDDGESWVKLNEPSVGQFYSIYADNQTPYNVYGGLQDNGVWTAVHSVKENKSWLGSGKNPYTSLMGGDGMQVQVDDRNPNIVFTGYQFGNYFRVNRETGKETYIQPKHTLGEEPYRFNWQTPILLSKHNQDILYLGGNKLHRSLNQGETWETISNDLTTGGKKGNVAFGTLTTLSESPFKFGLIYVGSDDGYIHVTKNGGGSWERISNNLPQNLWVSRVIASSHKKERVYATLNGYRFDDFTSYVYVSDDYGKTWKNIGTTLPISPVNVLKEDPVNEDLLYLGTDNGLYASLDRGMSWQSFVKNLPNVAVHDLVIQPTAKHLIVGTHGRSIYKANIASLQLLSKEISSKNHHVFEINDIRKSGYWGRTWSKWLQPNTPEVSIGYYSKKSEEVTVSIYNDDILVNSFTSKADAGLNEFSFDLSFSDKGRKSYMSKYKDASVRKAKNGVFYLSKGNYTVKIGDSKTSFKIK